MTGPAEPRREAIARVVRETVAAILPAAAADGIPGDRHLRDLGADSVDSVEIIVSIMERLGIHTPMSSFSEVKSIDAMVDLLCETKSQ